MIQFVIKLIFFYSIITVSFSQFYPPENYAFSFPNKPNTAAAILYDAPIPEKIQELSISLWVHLGSKHHWTPFVSYALPHETNIILLGLRDNKWNWVVSSWDDHLISFNTEVKLNEWVNYVLTWNSTNGYTQLYVNGEIEHSAPHNKVKDAVWSGEDGILVLGQDQDKYGGGFDRNEYFHGVMTKVNIWKRVLSYDEVQKVCTSELEGNLIAWSKTVWTLANNISTVGTPELTNCRKGRKKSSENISLFNISNFN